MDRLKRSYNMVMFLLLGLIFGTSGSLLDIPVLTPVLYTGSSLCGLVFSELALSSIDKNLSN